MQLHKAAFGEGGSGELRDCQSASIVGQARAAVNDGVYEAIGVPVALIEEICVARAL